MPKHKILRILVNQRQFIGIRTTSRKAIRETKKWDSLNFVAKEFQVHFSPTQVNRLNTSKKGKNKTKQNKMFPTTINF
jgi:CRISPR/Cas system-associated protein Cas5 (RAMP superfamily)